MLLLEYCISLALKVLKLVSLISGMYHFTTAMWLLCLDRYFKTSFFSILRIVYMLNIYAVAASCADEVA